MPAYLLRPGSTPGVALYTCCEDELLCRAELLALLEKANRNSPQDQQVRGYYDVDPTDTIARFKRGYRGRAGDYQRLMALRGRIVAEGWPFPELPRPADPGSTASHCPVPDRAAGGPWPLTHYTRRIVGSFRPPVAGVRLRTWRSTMGVLGRVATVMVKSAVSKAVGFLSPERTGVPM